MDYLSNANIEQMKLCGGYGEMNMCDTCTHSIPTCKGNPKFGNGVGSDNVIECDEFMFDDRIFE